MNRIRVFTLGLGFVFSFAGWLLICAMTGEGTWTSFFRAAADPESLVWAVSPFVLISIFSLFPNNGGRRRHYGAGTSYNPANGLPMTGNVDVHGNPWGFNDRQH